MSRSTTPQPETHGVTHSGQAPQVAVRDGNRLLCPCCGQTLMVLKQKRFTPPKMHHVQGDPRRTWPSLERLIAEQEAHYQNGATNEADPQSANQEEETQGGPGYRADSLVVPIDPKITAHEFPPFEPPPFDPPQQHQPVKVPTEGSSSASAQYKPPRDWNTRYEEHQRRRRKQPLQDATTYEMARLYAWAYYRLQRLAVQIEKEIVTKQAEVDALQTKLSGAKNEPAPVKKSSPTNHQAPVVATTESNTPADLGVARGKASTTGNDNAMEKAMTMTPERHAHADEGMAPSKTQVVSRAATSSTIKRGPP